MYKRGTKLLVRLRDNKAELVDPDGTVSFVPEAEIDLSQWTRCDPPLCDSTKPITLEMVQRLRIARVSDLAKPERKKRAPKLHKGPAEPKSKSTSTRRRKSTVDPSLVTTKLAGMSPEQQAEIRKAFGL